MTSPKFEEGEKLTKQRFYDLLQLTRNCFELHTMRGSESKRALKLDKLSKLKTQFNRIPGHDNAWIKLQRFYMIRDSLPHESRHLISAKIDVEGSVERHLVKVSFFYKNERVLSVSTSDVEGTLQIQKTFESTTDKPSCHEAYLRKAHELSYHLMGQRQQIESLVSDPESSQSLMAQMAQLVEEEHSHLPVLQDQENQEACRFDRFQACVITSLEPCEVRAIFDDQVFFLKLAFGTKTDLIHLKTDHFMQQKLQKELTELFSGAEFQFDSLDDFVQKLLKSPRSPYIIKTLTAEFFNAGLTDIEDSATQAQVVKIFGDVRIFNIPVTEFLAYSLSPT